MNGRRVLITGGSGGIGKVAATALAGQGAEVVIVGRNPQKVDAAVAEIKTRTSNPKVSSLLADLSSMKDVRALAEQFLQKFGSLDVLLNNAGAMNPSREVTVDGFERTFATNHLAYFLLSNLLVPALKKGTQPRVVSVASAAHRGQTLDFDDLQSERYAAWRSYSRSKLANILFAREFARRFKDTGLTSNSLHPGFVASDFLTKGGIFGLVKPLANLFALDENAGAKTSIYLCSSDEVKGISGEYFVKCKVARPTRAAQDDAVGAQLWDVSAKLVGLSALT